ncbi:hypothetical protein DRE_02808 [Drechslerella stenobrocha 248]|uniref:Uncharacterized protein n=1 Tax=Drechslerella stenobrocha 248 TaxID=1043628 RepID=W7HUN6_9PEZI|nr:hypothetical protein DRE_02808 [Drechslerella stenobrocha 248]
MGTLLVVSILFFIPLLLLIIWLAVSSCLGDSLRAPRGQTGWAAPRRQRQMERERQRDVAASQRALYGQMRDQHGGAWEVVEMQDMMRRESEDGR